MTDTGHADATTVLDAPQTPDARASDGLETSDAAQPTDATAFPSDGASQDDSALGDAATGLPFDAGYYYGDGSFFVDGGAYPDTGVPTDATADSAVSTGGDASPGCATLAVCCSSLSAPNQALCDTLVGLGNGANCSTELVELQAAGNCTGVSILASDIQVPPNLLVSDGTFLFWTTTSTPALLAMPVRGGPTTILLSGPVGNFLAVDAVNVYVLENDELVRIPKNGGGASLVSESGVSLAAATSLRSAAYWVEYAPGAMIVRTAPLLGGPISTLVTFQSSIPQPRPFAVTSSSIFLPNQDGGLVDFPMNGQPASGIQPAIGPVTLAASDTKRGVLRRELGIEREHHERRDDEHARARHQFVVHHVRRHVRLLGGRDERGQHHEGAQSGRQCDGPGVGHQPYCHRRR